MQMVLDIDENVFTRLFDNSTEDYAIVNDDLFAIAKAIRKGISLPKGHGRLIDADAFITTLKDASKRQKYKELLINDCLTVDDVFEAVIGSLENKGLAEGDAPTIIEADKTESEG